jgi:hypothetical protein
MKKQKYSEIRDSLKTGDTVLFSGKGKFSRIIRMGTMSRYSHTGIVLRLPEYDAVLILESTSLNQKILDVEDNIPKNGVQVNSLSERIKHYNGRVYVKQLNKALGPEQIKALVLLKAEIKNRPYEESKWELIRSALGMLETMAGDYYSEDLSSLFCSELNAEAYQRMKLLPDSPPSNSYNPKEISKLNLINGFELGETCQII